VEDLEALLRRQGGLARRRDVLQAGVSRRGLERLVRQGRLRVLTPHLVTDVDQPVPDQALRALAVGLQGTVSHATAAVLWGMELATTPDRLSITVDRNRSRVVRAGARVHRQDLSADDRVHRDGLWLTTPLRTVLDLCRELPLAEAVVVADSALRRGLVTVEDLVAGLRALPRAVGRGRVTAAVRLVDPRSGSVLESLCRVLLHHAGVPAPETQLGVLAADGRWIGRVDFAWPEARLVVETDGYAFHADRASYRSDRRRGNALVLSGWRVLRFSWEDVVHSPDVVVAEVRAALAVDGRTAEGRSAARLTRPHTA
jgi:hypothetical protein